MWNLLDRGKDWILILSVMGSDWSFLATKSHDLTYILKESFWFLVKEEYRG